MSLQQSDDDAPMENFDLFVAEKNSDIGLVNLDGLNISEALMVNQNLINS